MRVHTLSLYRIRTLFLCLLIVMTAAVLLLRPAASAAGISRGLSVCSSVIIPTVFPFLVLSGFAARSGVAAAIGRRLNPVTRCLFGLPGCAGAGILIAWLGGYPAGAAVIGELVRTEQLTREEGERMLRFCVCGGPGFLIATVGNRLLNSTAFGVLLFAAHVTAAGVIGILGTPRHARRPVCSPVGRHASPSPAEAFTQSVGAACQSLLTMCGFVTLFSALLALLDALLPSYPAILPCLLEVSCGCVTAASLRGAAPLLLGFTVGFGGLSVHCQIAATLSGTGVMTSRFWITRLLHGCLTALFAVLLLQLFPVTLPVFGSDSTPLIEAFSGSVTLSVFTLILCGIWLLSVDKDRTVTYNETHKMR